MSFRGLFLILALLSLAACSPDLRETPLAEEEIWDNPVLQTPVDEAIEYEMRSNNTTYGLPRDGKPGIRDLIQLFPTSGLNREDPSIFSSADFEYATNVCPSWSSEIWDELPMEIEGVVTIYPRQYQKVPVCGQDERHYGSYTIEDDTGGLLVLRDSRVAPFTYGDRIKLKVHATTLTFGRDVDTRAILVADVEPAEMPRVTDEDGNERISKQILYQVQNGPFGSNDVTQVKRITGYVLVEPTNDNFNSMVVTSTPITLHGDVDRQGDLLQCTSRCEVALQTTGKCPTPEAWRDVCLDTCIRKGGTEVSGEDLPACWQVGIDAELGRRGFTVDIGKKIQATGPVVNSYGYQMWVLSYGQVEILDSDE